MAITTLNNRAINRSDTAASGQLWTATSAVASDFQAAAGGGKILQVLTARTEVRVDISSTTYTDVGLSIAITPSATSSKIYAMWTMQANQDASRGYGCKLLRDTTAVFTSPDLTAVYSTTNSFRLRGTFWYLDSPSSTSEITYKVQCATIASGQVDFQETNGSDLMLMEVGG